MPTIVRREPVTCAVCRLQLTVLHTNDGAGDAADSEATIEFDVAEWTRLCRHTDQGSPLVCPSLRPLVKDWLGRP